MKLKNNLIITVILCIGISSLSVSANSTYNPFFGKEMIYKNDFNEFVDGSKGYTGCTFTNDSQNGGVVGTKIDSFHGTSMQIVDLHNTKDSYQIDGYFELRNRTLKGKYIFEFELYPVSELTSFFTMTPYSSGSAGEDFFTIFGKNIKVGSPHNDNVGYRGELGLGKWNKIQIMLDFDNSTYALYLNGKQLDDKKYLDAAKALTRISFKTYSIDTINHGDIYIDNVCFYKTDKEPNKDSIDWKVTVGENGELSILFAEEIEPALVNKNNIALYKDGKRLNFSISEKSAFGCMLNPIDKLKDAEYELIMDNVFGIGGQKLSEDTIWFRGTAGTYQYIIDKQDCLTTEVTGNAISVINKTGKMKSYVLLTGYYKDGVLHNINSIIGISEASEIRKNYNITVMDGYEIKTFIVDRELSDIYFN